MSTVLNKRVLHLTSAALSLRNAQIDNLAVTNRCVDNATLEFAKTTAAFADALLATQLRSVYPQIGSAAVVSAVTIDVSATLAGVAASLAPPSYDAGTRTWSNLGAACYTATDANTVAVKDADGRDDVINGDGDLLVGRLTATLATPTADAYAGGTTYAYRDVVIDGGNLFVSMAADNVGHLTNEGAWWQQLTWGGLWAAGTDYALYALVKDGAAYYAAIMGDPVAGIQTSDGTKWLEVPGIGEHGLTDGASGFEVALNWRNAAAVETAVDAGDLAAIGNVCLFYKRWVDGSSSLLRDPAARLFSNAQGIDATERANLDQLAADLGIVLDGTGAATLGSSVLAQAEAAQAAADAAQADATTGIANAATAQTAADAAQTDLVWGRRNLRSNGVVNSANQLVDATAGGVPKVDIATGGVVAYVAGNRFSVAQDLAHVLAGNLTTYIWVDDAGAIQTATNGWPGDLALVTKLGRVTTDGVSVTAIQDDHLNLRQLDAVMVQAEADIVTAQAAADAAQADADTGIANAATAQAAADAAQADADAAQAAIDAHTGDGVGAHAATAVSILEAQQTALGAASADVAAALTALQASIDAVEVAAGGDITAHTGDADGAHAASAISFTAGATGLVADDVQAALVEIDTNVDTAAAAAAAAQADADTGIADAATAQAAIDAHTGDADGAHAATAVSITGDQQTALGAAAATVASGLTALKTLVDAAQADADTGIADAAAAQAAAAQALADIAAHLADEVGAHAASAISFSNAASGMTADTVQEALDEIDTRLDGIEYGEDSHAITQNEVTNAQTNAQGQKYLDITLAGAATYVTGKKRMQVFFNGSFEKRSAAANGTDGFFTEQSTTTVRIFWDPADDAAMVDQTVDLRWAKAV